MKKRISRAFIILALIALNKPFNVNAFGVECITTGNLCRDWVQTSTYCFCFSTLTGSVCSGWNDGQTEHMYCDPIIE